MDASNPPLLALMRPASYREKSEKIARAFGFEPVYAPMIRLEGIKDEGFEPFIKRVVEGSSDYVIFTSANGIIFTLDKLSESEKESFTESLKQRKILAIGPNTQRELEKIGISESFMPGDYSSTGIVEALGPEVKGKTVDIARSAYGAKVLVEGLRECGATVHETHVYTLGMPEGPLQQELIERTLAGEVRVFAFTSSMMVRNFLKHAEKAGAGETIKEALSRALVGAIGTPTADTLRNHGIKVDVVPDEFTFDALLAVLKKKL
ncbi:MAG: uroporphyrinogen-III synthase [Methanosarcinaceae archaeon]|nr:uroporphyrinogen-III synthase [Methanosarcinaceae archaeon]